MDAPASLTLLVYSCWCALPVAPGLQGLPGAHAAAGRHVQIMSDWWQWADYYVCIIVPGVGAIVVRLVRRSAGRVCTGGVMGGGQQ